MANIPLSPIATSDNWSSYTISNTQVNTDDLLYIPLTASNVYDVYIIFPSPIILNCAFFKQFVAGQDPAWDLSAYIGMDNITQLTVTNQSGIGFMFLPTIPTGVYSITIQVAQYS